MHAVQYQTGSFETKSQFQDLSKTAKPILSDINGHVLALILAHADIESPLVGGHIGLRVSKQMARRNDMRAVFGRYSETISDITIVWSEYNSSIVTVLRAQSREKLRLN